MAYIICSTEEALLTKETSPPVQQPRENLAIISPGQSIAVFDHSLHLIGPDLAQLTLAGQFTWAPGTVPLAAGSILFFNPKRFHIPESAWEVVAPPPPGNPSSLANTASTPLSQPGQAINQKLTNQDIVSIANRYGLEPETVQAVMEVESSGSGFLPSGKPKILFEAHWFGEFTNDIYTSKYPTISCRTWDEARNHYEGGEKEWGRLNLACQLDEIAALKSASWGIGQVMGFNFEACGYTDVRRFVDDMKMSEGKQLAVMFKFMESKQLIEKLRKRDWANFAYGYNGEGYKVNNYDGKLEDAYNNCIKRGAFKGLTADATHHPPPSESLRSPFNPDLPVNWNNMNCRVSKYFTVAEVTQREERRKPAPGSSIEQNILALAKELDRVRELWQSPIGVSSWYRPPEVNAAVGGVSNSQHLYGLAADIYTMDSDGFSERDRQFEKWLDKEAWSNRALGYGIASQRGFTHVDMRQGPIRWNY